MRGHIEVSRHETIGNSSRPSGSMESCHTFTKHGGVKKTTRILSKHKAEFSHYVESIRSGRIAVYIVDEQDVYMSLRLKHYSHTKLNKIKHNLKLIKKAV